MKTDSILACIMPYLTFLEPENLTTFLFSAVTLTFLPRWYFVDLFVFLYCDLTVAHTF